MNTSLTLKENHMNIELTLEYDEVLKIDLFELDFYTSEYDLIYTAKGTFSVDTIYGKNITTHVDLDHFQITNVKNENDEEYPIMFANESFVRESLRSMSEVQGMIEDLEDQIGMTQARRDEHSADMSAISYTNSTT